MPIGTDMFVRNFVAKTCRDIIDDVEKLDAIQDGFIHFQLLRFCQATRLQYINSHIMLNNRCVLQQQHVVVLKRCRRDDWGSLSSHRHSYIGLIFSSRFIQGNTKMSTHNHMVVGFSFWYKKGSNAKKESICCAEP